MFPWELSEHLINEDFNRTDAWTEEWAATNPDSLYILPDPTQHSPWFDLSRSDWTALNCMRLDTIVEAQMETYW